jgi:predicted dehydrogenase
LNIDEIQGFIMKILMVGLGGIGQRHVRNLRTLLGPDVDIIAVRYINNSHVLTDQLKIEDGSDLVEKYAIKVCANLEQALSQQPNAVFICNPSSLHIQTALQAAQAGCNLFIEKPLSDNLEGVEELINIIESQNIKAVVGYQMRFHPCLMRLRLLIQERSMGKILAVRVEVGDYLPGWHTYEDYRQMYASKKELGGGVILTQIHELDYIYWLFGLPRRIFAVGGHLSSLEINVEDTVAILMEYFVDGYTLPVSVHLDYVQQPPVRTCEIIGDSGKILLDLRAYTINVFDSHGKLIEASSYEGLQWNQFFLDELKCFLEYLHGEQVPLVTIREAAQSLRISLAAKESLQTGNIISLTGGMV